MEENNNINKFMELLDSKISKDFDVHYLKLLKYISNYLDVYNEYIELDKRLFNIRKDLGFKKRELDKLNNELKKLGKNFDYNISSLIYLEDNKINYDFNLWLANNEKTKKNMNELEKTKSSLDSSIIVLIEEENKVIELKNKLIPKLNYLMTLINVTRNKKIFLNNNIVLKDLMEVKSYVDDNDDKLLLEKYFILSIRLKGLMFSYIDNFLNNLNRDNIINDNDLLNINIIKLCLIGLNNDNEIDLDVMINNPIFKDKVSLFEIIFDYFNNGNLDTKDLEQFNHIEFVNRNNMWFLDLINLLSDNNKNSNKVR